MRCVQYNSRIYTKVIALARQISWHGGEMESSYFCKLIACPGCRVSLRRRFTLLLFRDTRWNNREMLLSCESLSWPGNIRSTMILYSRAS